MLKLKAKKRAKREKETGEGDEEKEQLPSIIPPEAQQIIRDIIGQLRQSHDLSEILQLAIERLVNELKADRGLIWQIVGDEQLAVTNEVSSRSDNMFVGTRLGNQESTAVVMDFLFSFPLRIGNRRHQYSRHEKRH